MLLERRYLRGGRLGKGGETMAQRRGRQPSVDWRRFCITAVRGGLGAKLGSNENEVREGTQEKGRGAVP